MSMDAIAQLEKFAELKEKGILTAEEFELKKEELLNSGSSSTGQVEEGIQVSNVLIWFLAFAPLIGFFLEYVIAGMFLGERKGIRAVENGSFFWVTIVLNITLSIWDEKRVNAAGCDTSSFKWANWLVPVYLFKRAQVLKQNQATFIIWLICFVLILFS